MGPYKSLDNIISPIYDNLASAHKDKPIMLGEISTEHHARQPEWYTEAFQGIKAKPRIGAVIIMEGPLNDFSYGYDLRLTPESRKTLREVFKDPYWILAH